MIVAWLIIETNTTRKPHTVKNNTEVYRDKIKSADDVINYIQQRLVVSSADTKLKCKDIWGDYISWSNTNSKKRGKQCDLEDGIEFFFDIEKVYFTRGYYLPNIKFVDDS